VFVLLDDLRPNKSFLSQESVDHVRASQLTLVPVKVALIGNEWVLIEGHSRAYVAWERGLSGIEAFEVKSLVRRDKRLKHVSQLRILPTEEAGTQWGELCYMMDHVTDENEPRSRA